MRHLLVTAALLATLVLPFNAMADDDEDADMDAMAEYLMQGEGLTLERTKVGDRYVMERMRAGGFNLGGEQSGHIILHDYATTGDGLMSALQVLAVLVESGRPMSELARQFEPVPQKLENVRFTAAKPLEDTKVKAAIADAEARLAGQGRLLVRVMAEGDDEKLVRSVVAAVAAAVKAAG